MPIMTVKIDSELREALEALALNRSTPKQRVLFSQVVRELLLKGLADEQSSHTKLYASSEHPA